ncbi:hypothetical protein APR50_10445 [Variovorax paradoxus]|uniref:hypothetical protein n=1 Tax=Variovorax paradoxus TaxID=34073 RepID=UPI0006E65D5A|nr:hypothetical protein APR52_20695 [Variovorax paradoxus]KPV08882.1 hypothetical protein APR50_10445 [Variovorax paradoxus]KPV11379.1 hypothetical protein APR49_09320 [Variovorax paradoxus]KPV23271.1 hypothetical protein APR51_07895 [Variovorax paradoxus]KPV31163.1 hypothetical protein APR48_17710 [Variovorax paradoxus]
MTWDIDRLYALAIWPASAAIFAIAGCRLNAMPKNTRWPVVVEYAIWAAIAVGMVLLPLAGEWPGPGMVLLAYSLVVVLLCSARAWAGDVAPDEATDISALQMLSVAQRVELYVLGQRARVGAIWQRFKARRARS